MNPFSRFVSNRLLAAIEKRPWAALAVIVAYVIVPIDLLPEAFLGPLGAFDDVLAGLAGVAVVKLLIKRRRAARPKVAAAVKSPPAAPEVPESGRREEPPRRDDRPRHHDRPRHPDHRHRRRR